MTVEVEALSAIPDLKRLYGKALLTAALPRGDALPERELVVGDVTVERGRLTAYDEVCGFRLTDVLPVTYPHVLAFPLHIQLMAARDFPLPVAGLVHVRNVITSRRPLQLLDRLTLRVRAENLAAHRKGTTVDLVSEVAADAEPVWSSRSTYLARGVNLQSSGEASADDGLTDLPEHTAAVWRVPGDTGRRYARVSGDINPIHLNSLAARAFGFPRTIAHGMWSKARCLAAFEGRLADAVIVDVAFEKPLLLPGTARLLTAPADKGWDFALTSDDGARVHLRGAVR